MSDGRLADQAKIYRVPIWQDHFVNKTCPCPPLYYILLHITVTIDCLQSYLLKQIQTMVPRLDFKWSAYGGISIRLPTSELRD